MLTSDWARLIMSRIRPNLHSFAPLFSTFLTESPLAQVHGDSVNSDPIAVASGLTSGDSGCGRVVASDLASHSSSGSGCSGGGGGKGMVVSGVTGNSNAVFREFWTGGGTRIGLLRLAREGRLLIELANDSAHGGFATYGKSENDPLVAA